MLVTIAAIGYVVTEAGLTADIGPDRDDALNVYVPLGGGRGVILAPSEDGDGVTLDHVGAGPSAGRNEFLELDDLAARLQHLQRLTADRPVRP